MTKSIHDLTFDEIRKLVDAEMLKLPHGDRKEFSIPIQTRALSTQEVAQMWQWLADQDCCVMLSRHEVILTTCYITLLAEMWRKFHTEYDSTWGLDFRDDHHTATLFKMFWG